MCDAHDTTHYHRWISGSARRILCIKNFCSPFDPHASRVGVIHPRTDSVECTFAGNKMEAPTLVVVAPRSCSGSACVRVGNYPFGRIDRPMGVTRARDAVVVATTTGIFASFDSEARMSRVSCDVTPRVPLRVCQRRARRLCV